MHKNSPSIISNRNQEIVHSTKICRYGTQACAAISVIFLLFSLTLLLQSLQTHLHDNDAVLFKSILEEEAEQRRQSISPYPSKLSPSGYFYDHISGAIRLAFHRRSIQEWENDDNGNDHVHLSVAENRSKATFASDDLPVDNDLRNEASLVKNIEDVLFLKVSTLKERGGDNWFHKKRQFVSKNKMFISGLENLDSMLQDPDMPFYNQIDRKYLISFEFHQ